MRHSIAAAVVLAAVSANASSSAQTFTAQAVRTANFLDSVGVNIHLESEWNTAYSDQANGGTARFGTDPALGAVVVNGRTYTNVSKIISGLRYTGIAHARVLLPADYVADRLQAILQSVPTLKVDLLTSTFDTLLNQVVNRGGRFVNQVEAFEGLNEATYSASYNGLTGVAADCSFQSALWTTAQTYNNQHGTHVPVLAPSGTGNPNDWTALSTCAWAASVANGHLYTNAYPPTARSALFTPSVRKDAPAGSPLWASEAGMSTNPGTPSGMNEDVAAKATLSELLSYYKNNVARTYLYELVDENPQTPALGDNANPDEAEMHFGLFHNDWTPKETAQMLGAQAALLADPGATAWTFVPQALSYTVSGAPPATYSVLMQKSDGSFALAIWPEPSNWWVPATNASWGWQPAATATQVTVSFGQPFATVKVADPFAAGGAQGGPAAQASSVSVTLTDHPVYLMLKP